MAWYGGRICRWANANANANAKLSLFLGPLKTTSQTSSLAMIARIRVSSSAPDQTPLSRAAGAGRPCVHIACVSPPLTLLSLLPSRTQTGQTCSFQASRDSFDYSRLSACHPSPVIRKAPSSVRMRIVAQQRANLWNGKANHDTLTGGAGESSALLGSRWNCTRYCTILCDVRMVCMIMRIERYSTTDSKRCRGARHM